MRLWFVFLFFFSCANEPAQKVVRPQTSTANQEAPLASVSSLEEEFSSLQNMENSSSLEENSSSLMAKNAPPVIQKIPRQNVKYGDLMAIGVHVSDSDVGDKLAMSFSTKEGILEEKLFANGLLTIQIPEDIVTGVYTGIVTVKDSSGNEVKEEFVIDVEGKKAPSAGEVLLKEGVDKLCGHLQGIYKSLCEARQVIQK